MQKEDNGFLIFLLPFHSIFWVHSLIVGLLLYFWVQWYIYGFVALSLYLYNLMFCFRCLFLYHLEKFYSLASVSVNHLTGALTNEIMP